MASGMESAGKWIWCGLVGLMGVLGLFVSARADEPVAYWGGLVFFLFAVFFVMLQIKPSFEEAERRRH